jgi:hypothetical protein
VESLWHKSYQHAVGATCLVLLPSVIGFYLLLSLLYTDDISHDSQFYYGLIDSGVYLHTYCCHSCELADILCGRQTSDILYFEMLDLPLPELQGLKTLKIAYHNAKTEEVVNN